MATLACVRHDGTQTLRGTAGAYHPVRRLSQSDRNHWPWTSDVGINAVAIMSGRATSEYGATAQGTP